MGMPIQFTKILVADNSTSVAAVQAHATSGAVSLAGTAIASQRRIVVALTASNSGAVIIVAGTNESGTPIGETINVTATGTSFTSVMDYKSVTGITATTLTGNISVGTSATGSSPWQMANPWSDPVNQFVSVTLPTAGAATYSCECTLDLDPCGIRSNAPLTAVNAFSVPLLTALTTSAAALITAGTSGVPIPFTAWRLSITTGTGSCVVQAMDAGGGAG